MKDVLHAFLFISCLILFTGCKQPSDTPGFGDLVTSTSVYPTGTSTTPTFTPSPTQTPADPSAPTATFIPYPLARTKQRSICFNGPSEFYQPADAILENVFLVILGRSDGDDWFLVEGDSRCWITTVNLFYQFDINQIPILYTAFTTSNSTCRVGPNMQFNEQTYIPRGWRIFVNGKNSINAEWTLVTPHDSTKQCWIASNLLTAIDYYAIPVVETPTLSPVVIAPTRGGGGGGGGAKPTSTPTATKTQGPPPPTPTLCWPPGHCK